MAKQLTRAEAYKRNYRIIKNEYQNSVLAKRAQSWSDKRIYEELGIKVTSKKTPELKQIEVRQQSYYDRKFSKYIYARSQGIAPTPATKLRRVKREKIDSSANYEDARHKRFNLQNKHRRMDLWSEWSRHTGPHDRGNFPPAIEKEAVAINKRTEVAGKQLDDHAHYGYVVMFYMFVENKSFDEIKDLVKPDPHDSLRVRYMTTVRA